MYLHLCIYVITHKHTHTHHNNSTPPDFTVSTPPVVMMMKILFCSCERFSLQVTHPLSFVVIFKFLREATVCRNQSIHFHSESVLADKLGGGELCLIGIHWLSVEPRLIPSAFRSQICWHTAVRTWNSSAAEVRASVPQDICSVLRPKCLNHVQGVCQAVAPFTSFLVCLFKSDEEVCVWVWVWVRVCVCGCVLLSTDALMFCNAISVSC